ncbi:MAG: hypothetical protein LBK82_16310 [Planctomycetaceae bacterium]|jgi:hypothetical protein|nr:hypothetical protein [Planctomycetaceae bacterium]
MSKQFKKHFVLFAVFFSLFLEISDSGVKNSGAAEFRIDNEIQVEGSPEKITSTIFLLNGNFISLIGENGEITFFDSDKQIFRLLDPVLRIQTQLDAAETKKRVELLRQQVMTSPDLDPNTFNAFAVKPVFQSSEYEDVSGTLALQSSWVDYLFVTHILNDSEIVKQYFDSCDWVCYLHLRIDPRLTTMLVRLEVNRILREKNRFASRISVSVFPKGKVPMAKPDKAQSSHKIILRLDHTDTKRIDQAKEFQRTFTMISFDEYQKKVAEKKKN